MEAASNQFLGHVAGERVVAYDKNPHFGVDALADELLCLVDLGVEKVQAHHEVLQTIGFVGMLAKDFI
jgi:hypothetical protein